MQENTQLVLIAGESGGGKSASLMNIQDQPDWLYLNCESGKRLPFRNKFQTFNITDPYQVHDGFDHGTNEDSVKGIVVDTLTFMMDMFESQYVLGSADTMKGWSNYQQFFKELMQQKVPNFGKPTIMLAHNLPVYDENTATYRTTVPIKGALKNNGIEAFFSTVVYATKMKIKDLEKNFQNDLLHITEEERAVGFKHVFQTRITKETVGARIRSPLGMFTTAETYIDNDAQQLLNRLNEYYNAP
ncbi:hypothetical protein PP740_gp076 [Stenotrophomonas phage Philippe]|uniref:Uncharacterized protein n=1 Tax=Stenotrophomonas phage Philippe TaxID=2859655 RepID=A0AAE7WMK9_9CAUD|nr:hypothetical protein PP740_gp076 [Stenotrophomonas phage Philippe]QYW02266.1 hypothetical protein CPT_Philippe_073 [Stenotrophomonas phage Philippe]